MARYEMLNPDIRQFLLTKRFQETITRIHAPPQLELSEVTPEGEFVYLEHLVRPLHHKG